MVRPGLSWQTFWTLRSSRPRKIPNAHRSYGQYRICSIGVTSLAAAQTPAEEEPRGAGARGGEDVAENFRWAFGTAGLP